MTLGDSILATLAYHDIFNYPLTLLEIHKYQIGKKTSLAKVKTKLEELVVSKSLEKVGEYYCLKKRRSITSSRIQRSNHSKKKLKKAMVFAGLLKAIPTINMVAVSGALAMGNSTKNDDIDYAIITKEGRMWTTRLGVNIILFPFKRSPASKKQKDKLCLNLFIDSYSLKIPSQNLYIAHEIVQMKPIWQRQNAYYSFIKANSWVNNYLPNWSPDFPDSSKVNKRREKPLVVSRSTLVLSNLALVAEIFAKKFQLFYMKNKITTEKIGEHQLFFHPSNTQEWVLEEYNKRLKKLCNSFSSSGS